MSIPKFKKCPSCKTEKHNSEYHTRKDGKYLYLKSYCKDCCNKHKSKNKTYKKNLCECGNDKEIKSKMCKKCRSIKQKKYKTLGELREIFIEKYGPAYAYNIVRGRARKDNKIKECQRCGYDKHVEVCHIKPISSFSDDTLIDSVNNKDNILILCPNCHWEFDHNK